LFLLVHLLLVEVATDVGDGHGYVGERIQGVLTTEHIPMNEHRRSRANLSTSTDDLGTGRAENAHVAKRSCGDANPLVKTGIC